jgi:O-antigen ligase
VLLFFAPFVFVGLIVLPLGFEHAVFQSKSFQERQQGWTQNLNHAADPFGNGIGSTGAAAEKTIRIEATNANFYQPDNNYYKVLYELGVVGLYFFAATLIACLLFTRDAERRAPPQAKAFISGVTAHVLAVMTAAFTAVVFEIFPDDLMFWVLMGIVASSIRETVPAEEERVELSHS